VVKHITLPRGPQAAQATPGGQAIWDGSAFSGQIWVVNARHQKVSRTIFPRAAPNAGPIALTNSRTSALVVNSTFPQQPERGTVAVLNTHTRRVTSRIEVGDEPTGMAVDRKNNTTYVTNYQDDTVSYFRTPR
jgi:YVTN family beta-propeller protein